HVPNGSRTPYPRGAPLPVWRFELMASTSNQSPGMMPVAESQRGREPDSVLRLTRLQGTSWRKPVKGRKYRPGLATGYRNSPPHANIHEAPAACAIGAPDLTANPKVRDLVYWLPERNPLQTCGAREAQGCRRLT